MSCCCRGCVHHSGACSQDANALADTPLCDDCGAADFWGSADETNAAVTGGLSHKLNRQDLAFSRAFLERLRTPRRVCVDLGAGTGRVAASVLEPLGFSTLHLVEPSAPLLAAAQRAVPHAVANQTPAQRFEFPPAVDLVWINWLLMYMGDEHCVLVLTRAREALCAEGLVVVKENVGRAGVDSRGDRGRTRPKCALIDLFHAAGLIVQDSQQQLPWPKHDTDMWMFALRPLPPGKAAPAKKPTLADLMPPSSSEASSSEEEEEEGLADGR